MHGGCWSPVNSLGGDEGCDPTEETEFSVLKGTRSRRAIPGSTKSGWTGTTGEAGRAGGEMS